MLFAYNYYFRCYCNGYIVFLADPVVVAATAIAATYTVGKDAVNTDAVVNAIAIAVLYFS